MPRTSSTSAIQDLSPGTEQGQRETGPMITTPAELAAAAGLPADSLQSMELAHQAFPLRVPAAFVEAVGGAPQAVLRQVLPEPRELVQSPGYQSDPVGDQAAMAASGVIHKYHGRVLLVATGACAIHCRYCFRRHFPYNAALASRDGWREAVAYIAANPEISEVILSGGDPLMLEPRRLDQLTRQLVELPQIRRLRIHSRVPVVMPERINSELLSWQAELPWPTTLVIHANHPSELTEAAGVALGRLNRQRGMTLLNQAVLLAGVNDHPSTLCRLNEDLFELGVLPYYLHLLDPVQGAAHFHVDPARARSIMDELRVRLPGYLVPRLVQENAGAPYKLPVL